MLKLWNGDKIMRSRKLLIIYLLILFPIITICNALMNTGRVSINYSGFGVDDSGVLYVGKDSGIEKYKDGKMIGIISPQTSRGYAFTIQGDDTILLSTASTVYTLDLSGNVLDEWEDKDTSTFNKLQFIKKFTTKDGHKYVMKSHFGRTIICCNNEIIYQMPLLDYIVKILWFSCFFIAFIFAIMLVKQYLNRHKGREQRTQGDGSPVLPK